MLKALHRWLGVAIALWLIAAAASGALLLFEDEYVAWRYPALPDAGVLPAPDPEVIDTILQRAGRPVATLGQPTASLPAYHAWFRDGTEALYHPRSGERVATWTWSDALPAFLFELHVHLLSGETGKTLAGVLGLLAVINIVAGTFLWLRNRAVFRLRYALPKSTQRKALLRGHAAQGGLLAVVFVPLILSGVAIVFAGPVQAGLNAVLGVSGEQRPGATSIATATAPVDWAAVLDGAEQAFPAARLRFVTPPSGSGQPVVARLQNEGEWHPNGRSYAVLHPESGRVLERIDATQSGLGPSVFDSLYPLHAGKTGWPGYRLLLVVLAVSLSYIAASGAYLLLKRPRARRARAFAH